MTRGYALIYDTPTELSVNCEDFGVECFGGSYEYTYALDRAERDRLCEILRAEGAEGSLSDMIREYFGVCLEKVSFGAFCSRHHIRYRLSTWVS